MERKTNATVIITALIIVLIVFCIVSYFQVKNYNPSKNLIVDETYELKDIIIKSNAAKINIKETNEQIIKVKIYGDESKTTVKDFDKLNIEANVKEIKFVTLNKRAIIEVDLPKDFDNNVVIDCDYCSINIGDFDETIFDIKSNAGEISLGEVGNIKLDVNASDVKISKVTKKLDIEVDAGNINIDSLELIENSKIELNAGNVSIGSTNKINIESEVELGEIDINNNYPDSKIKLEIKLDLGNISVKN